MLAYTTSYFARSNYTGIAKFVSADFGLDKGSLGLLGSVFLYAYALAQLPWGFASDRWGSRKAIGIGVFLIGVTLWGFATSTSFNQLLFWRVANGIAAASVKAFSRQSADRWAKGLRISLFPISRCMWHRAGGNRQRSWRRSLL